MLTPRRGLSIFASALALATVLAVPTAAGDQNESLTSGPFRAVAIIGCDQRPDSFLQPEVIEEEVSLRAISFKAISGFHALATGKVGSGRTVGRISVAGWGSQRLRYNLVTPRRSAKGPARLLIAGKLRVVYRPGRKGFLSVYGLPSNTQSVFISTRRNTLLRRTSDRTRLDTTGFFDGQPSRTVKGDGACRRRR